MKEKKLISVRGDIFMKNDDKTEITYQDISKKAFILGMFSRMTLIIVIAIIAFTISVVWG